MIPLYYDLHLHSCLSPCGDDDMTPANIAGMASVLGLEAIALTDHNTARNCPAFLKACESYGIIGIPGMELTTEEEVHVVCLFPALENALSFDAYVYERLIKVKNNEAVFGKQQIYNENDEVTGTEPYLLINATTIGFEEVYDVVTEHGGIMIPAHVDKSSNSLIANLGFIPEGSRFKTAELKNMGMLHELARTNPYLNECRIITDSDAHYLEHMNEAKNSLYVEEKSVEGVLKALAGPLYSLSNNVR